MPKQKRWALKRQCDRTIEDIERAQGHLVEVYAAFQPVHPAEAEYLQTMGWALSDIAKAVRRFSDEVIG